VCPIKMLLGQALITAKWPGGNLYPASTHCTPFPVYKGQNQPKILFWFLEKREEEGERSREEDGWGGIWSSDVEILLRLIYIMLTYISCL
jgi:hypothetical protein